MNSITYRITGLMFLGIFLTVLILINLANYQMEMLFEEYLKVQYGTHRQFMGAIHESAAMMGLPEKEFMQSFHRSLFWVGGAILFVGLIASYLLAQSITVPLRYLSSAADAVRKGAYGRQVDISSDDEVGQLAVIFNRMSKALADNNSLRQRFLADIAHELKTPLTVIQGNLEGMLEGVIDRSDEQINSLYEETFQLNRMIRDLRDLTLAEAGQLPLEKKPGDINGLISRVLLMLEPLAEEKNIALVSKLGRIPEIIIDTDRIAQVFYNLITNALRYTTKNGKITISTDVVRKDGRKWIKIEVADNGIGIFPQDLPFIFDHFYRVDKSRDKQSGGSGIGLAIVKQLIENHGGTVEVVSERGKGSTFFMYLPFEGKNS